MQEVKNRLLKLIVISEQYEYVHEVSQLWQCHMLP